MTCVNCGGYGYIPVAEVPQKPGVFLLERCKLCKGDGYVLAQLV